MTTIAAVFRAHRPYRTRRFTFLDAGEGAEWFDEPLDRGVLERLVEGCYRPSLELFRELGARHGERFALGLSLSGTLLDQLEAWSPATLDDFRRLVDEGRTELLARTSHHSLAWAVDGAEFALQVEDHRARLATLFGARPRLFDQAGLATDARLFEQLERLGFDGLLCEGEPTLRAGRGAARVHSAGAGDRLRVLLRHDEYSDDVAFRSSNPNWSPRPLDGALWASWVRSRPDPEATVGLFVDLEHFGEQRAPARGVLAFFERAVDALLAGEGFDFAPPTRALFEVEPAGRLEFAAAAAATDTFGDPPPGLANPLQLAAHRALYRLAPRVRAAADRDPELLVRWRRLTSADHFYYMSLAERSDGAVHCDIRGAVHRDIRPFPTPHDAHIAFMNVLADLEQRLDAAEVDRRAGREHRLR